MSSPNQPNSSSQTTSPVKRPRFGLTRWLIRVRAYLMKELSELRRQPLLILSLVGGPLLVLVLFGSTFRNSNPVLRTVLITPPGGVPGISIDQIRALAGTNFQIVGVSEDLASAQAQLDNGEIDVVQVFPEDVMGMVQRGENPQIQFLSNAINPVTEGWIQYLAYAQVNEINKAFLRQQTQTAQQEASIIKVRLVDTRGQILELEQQTSPEQQRQAQEDLRAIRADLERLESQLPNQDPALMNQIDIADLRRRIDITKQNIDLIDQSITDGTLDQHLNELRTTGDELTHIEGLIDLFIEIPADRVVAPVQQTYSNLRGQAYQAVVFYTPGVLALLVQHTAITLGALALIRERLLGAFEVFRVAPVSMTQLLLGKYIAYTFFVALMTALMVGGLLMMGVPFLGDMGQFALLCFLLTLASLGVGFLISAVSSSDSQAIQLAMIALLLSIFFSGFFIALDSFALPAQVVSTIIPMSHGVSGMQNLMLRGIPPSPVAWGALVALSLISFVAVVFITRRQLAKA
jgi:ABC-2 type transport system permease protein